MKRKAYDKDGFALWVLLGNRKGWNKSDYRRVYVDDDGVFLFKMGLWYMVRSFVNLRVYAFGNDGETRDAEI
ncbi:MAG: hypothetical protein IJG69_08455 [Spirochaetales bacterium]|nr:hypothetical protein [Spirochaetales bacterium]